MESLLLEHGMIVTLDKNDTILRDGCLLVRNGKIAYVGTDAPEGASGARRIDCSGRMVMPGLVNAHTHIAMSLLRGLADDCTLDDWLRRAIWPAESTLTRPEVHTGSLLGVAEMLAYGTTSFSDMYHFSETVAEAVAATGMKANLCDSITCGEDYDPKAHDATRECMALVEHWNGYGDGLIKCDASIQSAWQSTPALWEFIAGYAHEQGIGIHMHLAETVSEMETCKKRYGKTPARLFYDAGVFRSRVTAAHCIYLEPEDLDIFAQHHASIVHDPCSNLKMCCGFANLKPGLERGVNIALGTDGVCSNNSGDLFETMKLTALNQKMITDDPCFLPAQQVLHCATMGGLAAQGRQTESGVLEVGRDADLIALDLSHPGLNPCINPVSNAVYAARGGHVNLTMVRGRILYEKGVFHTIDIERVLHDTQRIVSRF